MFNQRQRCHIVHISNRWVQATEIPVALHLHHHLREGQRQEKPRLQRRRRKGFSQRKHGHLRQDHLCQRPGRRGSHSQRRYIDFHLFIHCKLTNQFNRISYYIFLLYSFEFNNYIINYMNYSNSLVVRFLANLLLI